MRVFILFLVTVLWAACEKKQKDPSLTSSKTPVAAPRREIAGGGEVTVLLGESIDFARTKLQGNLYGKFFYDRAEYYIIDRPANQVMGSAIRQATLYYFDAALYRIQYKVDEDVVNSLINRAPHFSVKGLDTKNRDLLRNEPPVFQLSDRSLMLNPRLDAYEITWKVNQTVVRWKSWRSLELFEYSEFDERYISKYRELEKFQFERDRHF